ncbi:MAG: hypothetical protein P8Y05_09675 [Deinococcales bacterium]
MKKLFDIEDAAFERRTRYLQDAETWRLTRAVRQERARQRWRLVTIAIKRLLPSRTTAPGTPRRWPVMPRSSHAGRMEIGRGE